MGTGKDIASEHMIAVEGMGSGVWINVAETK